MIFNNFIIANESFAKGLWTLETCVSANYNL